MTDVPGSVVELLLAGVADQLAPEVYAAALSTATREEKQAAAWMLARAVVEPRTVLDLRLREVCALGARVGGGPALGYVPRPGPASW